VVYKRKRHFFTIKDLQRVLRHILLYDRGQRESLERSYFEFYEILVALVLTYSEVNRIQITDKIVSFIQGLTRFLLESITKEPIKEQDNGQTSG